MLKLTMAGADAVAPALPDAADSEVEVFYYHDGSVCSYCYTVSGQHWMDLPGLASFRFDSNTQEVKAIAQPSAQSDLIRDAYYRIVMPMALQALGQEVLHASAVLMPQGVVALCAVSQTGKSTIAYGLSQRGYPLWADNIVAFEVSGGCVRTIPLPFKIRLRPASASYFGQDQTVAHAGLGWDKVEQAEIKSTPLAALCVLQRKPDVGNGVTTEILRLSPSQAFTAVLTHAIYFSLQDRSRKRSMMSNYLSLTAQVPVFEIRFQSGLEKLPTVLDGIEQAINRALTEAI